jgi:hypothetical protein
MKVVEPLHQFPLRHQLRHHLPLHEQAHHQLCLGLQPVTDGARRLDERDGIARVDDLDPVAEHVARDRVEVELRLSHLRQHDLPGVVDRVDHE